MKSEGRRFTRFHVALGFVVIAVVVLGIRSENAATEVLTARRQGNVTPDPMLAQSIASAEMMSARDSILASSIPTGRDPFQEGTVRKPRATEPHPVRQAAPAPKPALRALLYDNIAPMIQLGVGEQISGWLHKGDQFQGWTVVEITSSSVEIGRSGERVVLPAW
ncbi:MAG: hypothetical protein GF346_09630 [Candidatus Eisenbacteria bacterium]|nr:hypothetical protein [Candidatus Latescibacterota bacterium]MBD3302693.1 hypothetical protein [Candidatus Eisenbacteria bacterium]